MAMSADSGVIAEFVDYASLHAALRLVREKRDISFEVLDELVGAPKGYFSKVFAPKAQRKITMASLGWAMAGLGVKCLVVDDPAALKQINGRMKSRDGRLVRNGGVHVILSRRFLAKIGRKGGVNSRKNFGKRMRRKLAREAALARWKSAAI